LGGCCWLGGRWSTGDDWAWDRVLWLLWFLSLLLNLLLGDLWGRSLLDLGSRGWSLLGFGSWGTISCWGSFSNWLWLNNFLQLVVYNLDVQWSGFLSCSLSFWHLDILNERSSSRLLLRTLDRLLVALLIDVSEDVVEDEVSGRLLSKNESLNKLLQFGGLVGGFTNNLDNDVVVRSLGVDVGDANLAVLEVEVLDALLNSTSADGNWSDLCLETRNKLRSLSIEEVKLFWGLAQGGVVLLDEVPSNLIL